jgi:hypothetical protein
MSKVLRGTPATDPSGSASGSGDPAQTPSAVTTRTGGKGRPTPTRKEQEAANKARAKAPHDRKAAARLTREKRAERSARMREGMRTGDERYLPARDKGPVRRFVRDWVDARLCMAEMLLPLLVVIMILSSVSRGASNGLWAAAILIIGLDTCLLVFRLRRELRIRFAGSDTHGAVWYAIMRSIQLRWLRMPKPQVKLGAKLPERY